MKHLTKARPKQPTPFHPSATRLERVPVMIFDEPAEMSRQAARRIATLVDEKRAAGEYAILGLPTGSTPIGVYQELVRLHRDDGLDFSNVVTFNLDEYHPIDADGLQSYRRFMFDNFFNHVNIDPANIHIPRGDIPREDVEGHCNEYERLIAKSGGIDLMLLGIGRSGHIGFNEPGSGRTDRTRLIVLDEITRKDAASDFFEEKYVPREAITMGVGTILEAHEIILMATGEHKAPIVRRAVEEEPSPDVSAAYLQEHPNTTFYVDRAAARELTRVKTPWLVAPTHWNELTSKRAVIWLSRKVDKPIPWLEARDFHRNHLHELGHTYGEVDDLTRRVYEDLRQRIRYREQLPTGERVIVFSPHPDDDVISMGGTLHKLVENKNDVTVAYMTNGSVAVFDQDVRRHLRFAEMLNEVVLDLERKEEVAGRYAELRSRILERRPADVDSDDIQKVKAYIRYTEAIAAIEVLGLDRDSAVFLDMPFYKTGRVRKEPIGPEDVRIVRSLISDSAPAHIFVAGDLSDPHGTHRMCYQAIKLALNDLLRGDSAGDGQARDRLPLVWLYRGAWQEWEVDEADVFVPMSKADLDRKIDAIYKHESQKDRALFPGAYDEREFWERARDRNRETAASLGSLGLPSFYAVEAFVNVRELP